MQDEISAIREIKLEVDPKISLFPEFAA